jgi:hypothetical protein
MLTRFLDGEFDNEVEVEVEENDNDDNAEQVEAAVVEQPINVARSKDLEVELDSLFQSIGGMLASKELPQRRLLSMSC